jgi:hypothetical protein
VGIIIGVAAVITMVTLGKGVTADIERQISSLGSNVFFVFPINTDRGQIRPFDERDVTAVREQIAGVNFVAGQVERKRHGDPQRAGLAQQGRRRRQRVHGRARHRDGRRPPVHSGRGNLGRKCLHHRPDRARRDLSSQRQPGW